MRRLDGHAAHVVPVLTRGARGANTERQCPFVPASRSFRLTPVSAHVTCNMQTDSLASTELQVAAVGTGTAAQQCKLAQVRGAGKSRVLIGEDVRGQMRTHSLIHTYYSEAPWPRVDLQQFPEYKHASALSYTINSGDTLYIPAYWWHWVYSSGDAEGLPSVALNMWTKRPHRYIFESGCDPAMNDLRSIKCGRVPSLFKNIAQHWPARTKWTLPYLKAQYEKQRRAELEQEDEAQRKEDGPDQPNQQQGAGIGAAPRAELFGTCTSHTDYIYPEMWGARVMGSSPFHAAGAPPKPNSFGAFVNAIGNATNKEDRCHLHIPSSHFPRGMARGTLNHEL